MNKRIKISVNQEDVQNIIDCYEKDIKYIKQLEAKVNQLETNRDGAIEELFILKNMIYKPETREENFEIQRKISAIIVELERGKE